MSASERLARLGLSLPAAAAPAGNYVPARRVGNLIYTSGQLPLVDGQLSAVGAVGHGDYNVSADTAQDCARTATLNALAAAADVAGGLDEIAEVIRVTGFVASAPDFTGQPGVVNGASDLLVEVFGEAGKHARSAVGVASLPLGSPVEIELILAVQ